MPVVVVAVVQGHGHVHGLTLHRFVSLGAKSLPLPLALASALLATFSFPCTSLLPCLLYFSTTYTYTHTRTTLPSLQEIDSASERENKNRCLGCIMIIIPSTSQFNEITRTLPLRQKKSHFQGLRARAIKRHTVQYSTVQYVGKVVACCSINFGLWLRTVVVRPLYGTGTVRYGTAR